MSSPAEVGGRSKPEPPRSTRDAVAEAEAWLRDHRAEPPSPVRGGLSPSTADSDWVGKEPTAALGPDGRIDRDADPEDVARRIVLRKLTAQARTRSELDRALRTRDVPEDAAAAVLDRMEEVGLVDDAAFAMDWVQSRQQRRHLSRAALRRELQVRGVARETIESALTGVDGGAEMEAARSLIERKLAATEGLDHDRRYRRLAGLLARRGFGAEVTARVLSEFLNVD